MQWKTRTGASSAGKLRFVTVAVLAILLTGCASYAEARLARPPAETVAAVPPDWASWIADLDDRMTGTCR